MAGFEDERCETWQHGSWPCESDVDAIQAPRFGSCLRASGPHFPVLCTILLVVLLYVIVFWGWNGCQRFLKNKQCLREISRQYRPSHATLELYELYFDGFGVSWGKSLRASAIFCIFSPNVCLAGLRTGSVGMGDLGAERLRGQGTHVISSVKTTGHQWTYLVRIVLSMFKHVREHV